jgi:hypothetical protein
MSVIVKHRTDMDVVAERVGLKLATKRPDTPAGSGDDSRDVPTPA